MCHASDRDLEPGHDGGVKRAQHADRRVAQGELHLPQRQQHIERIGKAVVQRVGAASDPENACFALSGFGCSRKRSARVEDPFGEVTVR